MEFSRRRLGFSGRRRAAYSSELDFVPTILAVAFFLDKVVRLLEA